MTRNESQLEPPPSRWQRMAPVVMLLLLAPVISEMLYGATRVSFLFALIPEIGVWGCGALLIRYVVRRWHRGWLSVWLLGLALALAEECFIQQTSLAPLIGSAANGYGRAVGVNWIYLIWALGYESIWVVVVPIQLTELVFPGRRKEPWLRTGGVLWAGLSFCLASFIAWFTWTKQARTKVFHLPPYDPPWLYLLLAGLAIALLVVVAFVVPVAWPQKMQAGRPSPRPWRLGLAAALLGLPWGTFVLVSYGTWLWIQPAVIIPLALGWALLAFLLLRGWTSQPGWQDSHRLAVVFGAITACMVSGFIVFAVGGAWPMDWIGKAIMNLAAVAGLSRLGRKIAR